ncbi:MAG: lysophospholipase [Candidatus Krumholzibacteria bacterium]|nr:lysophospholipase [Candidatus Krumholzibacteria bacterium]
MSAFVSFMIASLVVVGDPAGVTTWSGTLHTGGVNLRMTLHLNGTADGWSGTLDSPDQGAYGVPLGEITVVDGEIRFTVPSAQGTFVGRLDSTTTTMTGTWSQSGFALPLELVRTDESSPPTADRPQTPGPPFEYRTEDVSFAGGSPGVMIAGTLAIPAAHEPCPAVVLLSGSGPQDRDATMFGHKPFLVLADYLVRQGIAVLRTDDRGVAGSTGNFGAATTGDFARDAVSAVKYLRARPDVMVACIGLVGHSEGSVVATLAANELQEDVAFVVMLAGIGVPIDELLIEQARLLMGVQGASAAQVEANSRVQRIMFQVARSESDSAAAAREIRARCEPLLADLGESDRSVIAAAISPSIESVTSPWFRYLLSYDPGAALGSVRVPVLVLAGERDLQVPPNQNVRAIELALQAGGNHAVETTVFPGLNHQFQTATTGSISEYGMIKETMAPIVLDKIADWIGSKECAE